jgi:site-specific DNA-methyltransferase (adenine-specific)
VARYADILERQGFTIRQWITWYETFGVNQANKFNRCSRPLLYCVKDPKRFVFHAGAVNRPSARQAKYRDKRADPGGKVWDDVWGINPPIPRLVENDKERLPDFPTQLPLGLLRPVVGCASDPGDVVVDPFSGSGTTGAACLELGRRFLGIEKVARFAELARARLMTVQPAGYNGAGPDPGGLPCPTPPSASPTAATARPTGVDCASRVTGPPWP